MKYNKCKCGGEAFPNKNPNNPYYSVICKDWKTNEKCKGNPVASPTAFEANRIWNERNPDNSVKGIAWEKADAAWEKARSEFRNAEDKWSHACEARRLARIARSE